MSATHQSYLDMVLAALAASGLYYDSAEVVLEPENAQREADGHPELCTFLALGSNGGYYLRIGLFWGDVHGGVVVSLLRLRIHALAEAQALLCFFSTFCVN